MDYANLQRIIQETDAAYAMGQQKGGETGTWMMQNAVANRDAAIRAHEAYKASLPSAPAPAPSSGGGGGGPSYSPPPPPPPPPAPVLPQFTPIDYSRRNVLVAPSDIIQFDNSLVGVDSLALLMYEDIGSVELADISRADLIDGQEVVYSPIKNLSSIRRAFNPNNIIATFNGKDYFSRFGIDIFARGIYEPYFDEEGNLVVEIDIIKDGEELQVEVLSDGTIDMIEEA